MDEVLSNKQSAGRLTPLQEVTLSAVVPTLLAISRRILRHYPTVTFDCEDVVQDVLLETTQKLIEGNNIENLTAYLKAGVTNRAINLAKKLNHSRGILFELDNGFTGYMVTAVPDERIDLLLETERQLMTYRAILEDRERLVLDMLLEGFAPKEMAEVLGVRPSSLYVITHRLRRKFSNLVSGKKVAQAGKDGKNR